MFMLQGAEPPADFDPREPGKGRSQNPLAAYLTTPTGIGGIASIQIVLGLLFFYTAARQYDQHTEPRMLVSLLALGILFLGVGAGFWRCHVWAWWLIGAIYWFLLVNSIVQIGRYLAGKPEPLATFLWIGIIAQISLLAYIRRPAVLRHFHFRRDPSTWLRWSPAGVGICASLAVIYRQSM
jgi:hypothetical protein